MYDDRALWVVHVQPPLPPVWAPLLLLLFGQRGPPPGHIERRAEVVATRAPARDLQSGELLRPLPPGGRCQKVRQLGGKSWKGASHSHVRRVPSNAHAQRPARASRTPGRCSVRLDAQTLSANLRRAALHCLLRALETSTRSDTRPEA